MKMNARILYLVGTLMISNCVSAASDPSNLIKVTPQNDAKCVEYYSYNAALYCSTKKLVHQEIGRDIKDFETQAIVFDHRPWLLAGASRNDTETDVHYIPLGDDYSNWHESVSSKFFPGTQDQFTPKDFAENMLNVLQSSGMKPSVTYIIDTPDQIIMEVKVNTPKGSEFVIQKFSKGTDGIYALGYTIKEADMSQKNRDLWIKNLSSSKNK